MSTAPPSLWRVVAYTVLFWLLKWVVLPASRYTVALLIAVFFICLSPFVLLAYGYSAGAKLRYENA